MRLVDGELVVLDRRQERIHHFNKTAGFIFRQCEGRSNMSEIARRTAEAFDADVSSVAPHVESTLNLMRAEGLLEQSPEARL